MTPYVLMIALGIHSIFEGLATGITDNEERIEQLIIGIVLHKGAAGMSLGISMVKNFPGQKALIIKLLLLFASFTPFGVTLGWLLELKGENTANLVSAFAAGTFVYIACTEIISEEFSKPDNKKMKLTFFLMGVALIASLFWLEPPHTH